MFKFKWKETHCAYTYNYVAVFGDEFTRLDSRKAAFTCHTEQWENFKENFTTEYVLWSYVTPVLMVTIDHDALNNVKFCTVRFNKDMYRYSATTISQVSCFLNMLRSLYRHSPSIPTYSLLKHMDDTRMQNKITFMLNRTLFYKWTNSSFQYLVSAIKKEMPVWTTC